MLSQRFRPRTFGPKMTPEDRFDLWVAFPHKFYAFWPNWEAI